MFATKNESFIRWQNITIQQLGSVSNLILVLSTGLLAFQTPLLLQNKLNHCFSFTLSISSLFILLLSVIIAVFCALNRLKDFRLTAQIARKRETNEDENLDEMRNQSTSLGACTWVLFNIQIWSFTAGAISCVFSFIVEIFAK